MARTVPGSARGNGEGDVTNCTEDPQRSAGRREEPPVASSTAMAVLRLFAAARTAAGTARATTSGATVAEVLDDAVARYGEDFAAVLTTSAVWVDGEPATGDTPVTDAGEVAVLPPVSGG